MDPYQLASVKPADLDLHYFQKQTIYPGSAKQGLNQLTPLYRFKETESAVSKLSRFPLFQEFFFQIIKKEDFMELNMVGFLKH